MNDPETDLSRLGKRQPPEPSRATLEAAQRAALDAFDQAAKKNVKATQGSGWLARLHRIATQTWSLTMHAKYLSGSALATLVIVPIAGIAAWQVMQDYSAPPVQTEQTEVKKDVLAKTEVQASPTGQTVQVRGASDKKENGLVAVAPAKPAEPALGRVREEAPLTEPLAQQSLSDTAAPPAATAQSMNAAPAPMAEKRKMIAEGEADAMYVPPQDQRIIIEDRDKFPVFKSNSSVSVAMQPVSTFSVDVDTSGYSSLRRALNQGVLPDKDASLPSPRP